MNKKIVVTRLLLAGHLIVCFNRSLFAGNFLDSGSLGSVGALPPFQTQTFSPAGGALFSLEVENSVFPRFPGKSASSLLPERGLFGDSCVFPLLSGTAPSGGLPFFLEQATTTDKPLAFTIKQTDDDKFDDSFDDENKTKAFDKHDEPDDFDNLSMPFEHDSGDESELPADNKREDSAKNHVILEWNDTEQKITRRQVHVATHELTEEKHLHVNIDLTAELAELLKAPEINATSIAFPRASSPESVYPVTQNEEGESSDGDENESEETDDYSDSSDLSISSGSDDPEESMSRAERAKRLVFPEELFQAVIDRGRTDDGLTHIQLDDVREGQLYYGVINLLKKCSLTEAGAAELQADNPQLFATPEAARAAFETLRQGGFKKNWHTLEHQRLARLIDKYEARGNGGTAMNILFSNENKNQLSPYTVSLDHSEMTEYIHESQLKPLQVADDESLLVICSKGTSFGHLTKAGSRELQNRHPNLFQTDDAAIRLFKIMDLHLHRSTRRKYIATEQYQAIAKLIQEYKQTGNVEFILINNLKPKTRKPEKYGKRSHSSSDDDAFVPRKAAKTGSSTFSENRAPVGAYIDTIPYGMLRHGFLSFEGQRRGEREVSSKSRKEYELSLRPGKCFSAIKELVHDRNKSSDDKIATLRLIFIGDVTLNSLMESTEWLLGSVYKQAKESFESHYSQMNKPDEDDRPNVLEDEHNQPDHED